MLQATKFEKENTILVHLDRGDWMIDGKPCVINGYPGEDVVVEKIDDIRRVNTTHQVTHYLADDKIVSLTEYAELKAKLTHPDDGWWPSLEEEYQYRKFFELYKPVKQVTEIIGDPEKVDLQIIEDTGSKFITHPHYYSKKSPGFYVYHRHDAMWNLLKLTMTKLGVRRVDDSISYNGTTKSTWCGDGLRFSKAFGQYICPNYLKDIKPDSVIRGDLKTLKDQLAKDSRCLVQHITAKYNLVNNNSSLNLSKIVSDISQLETLIRRVVSKKSTEDTYRLVLHKIVDINNKIEAELSKDQLEGDS